MKVKTKVKAGWCDHACKKACREKYYRCGTAAHCNPRFQSCIERCGCS
jgi:hypothetical protein